MTDRCAACGRPIIAVRRVGPPIRLNYYVWRHVSWWANRTHAAIPEGSVQRDE